MSQKSTVRLMQEGGARLVVEEERAVVYHTFANPREDHMEGGDDDEDVDVDDDDDDDDDDEDAAAAAAAAARKGKGKEVEEEEEEEEEEEDLGALRFDLECGPALETLLHAEDAAEEGVGPPIHTVIQPQLVCSIVHCRY